MSVHRTSGTIFLIALTVLIASTPSHGSNGDSDFIATHVSENEIYGDFPRENIAFLIQSGWHIMEGPAVNGKTYGKRMTKIELYLGDKTLFVQAGRGELYIKGFNTGTGVLTSLTAREKRLLKDALENNGTLELGEPIDLLLRSLDALSSWPQNMLVFIWHDADEALSAVGKNRLATMPRKDFDERNNDAIKLIPLDRQALEALTPPVLDMTATDVRERESLRGITPLCYAIGHKYTGRYFECDDFFCIDRTNHRYVHLVGGPACFGRCGTGCTGYPHGRKYTRDCFNHDACVLRLGTTAVSCDIMFTYCADDVTSAKKCPIVD
jgi:hypothetical protein